MKWFQWAWVESNAQNLWALMIVVALSNTLDLYNPSWQSWFISTSNIWPTVEVWIICYTKQNYSGSQNMQKKYSKRLTRDRNTLLINKTPFIHHLMSITLYNFWGYLTTKSNIILQPYAPSMLEMLNPSQSLHEGICRILIRWYPLCHEESFFYSMSDEMVFSIDLSGSPMIPWFLG